MGPEGLADEDGELVGSGVGGTVGCWKLGLREGCGDGYLEGKNVGTADGTKLSLGDLDGAPDSTSLGDDDKLGLFDGVDDSWKLGLKEGGVDGSWEGKCNGWSDGTALPLGDIDGWSDN